MGVLLAPLAFRPIRRSVPARCTGTEPFESDDQGGELLLDGEHVLCSHLVSRRVLGLGSGRWSWFRSGMGQCFTSFVLACCGSHVSFDHHLHPSTNPTSPRLPSITLSQTLLPCRNLQLLPERPPGPIRPAFPHSPALLVFSACSPLGMSSFCGRASLLVGSDLLHLHPDPRFTSRVRSCLGVCGGMGLLPCLRECIVLVSVCMFARCVNLAAHRVLPFTIVSEGQTRRVRIPGVWPSLHGGRVPQMALLPAHPYLGLLPSQLIASSRRGPSCD